MMRNNNNFNKNKRFPIQRYGQIVYGSPGSGKTTYCNGMQQYLRAIGRECLVVNFDPANETIPTPSENNSSDDSNLPYDTLLDVCQDVINLNSVMEELKLGPNGGLLYCLEYMEKHSKDILDLISSRLDEHELKSPCPTTTYVLFDFPGQVELFTHNTSVQNICQILTKEGNFRLAAVQLIDAHHCLEPSKFISAVLLSTTTMLRLELPTINVLSKVDLLVNKDTGDMQMQHNFDFFTKAANLKDLIYYLDSFTTSDDNADTSVYFADDKDYQAARAKKINSRFYRKYKKLHEQLCEVIDDFNLVSFLPLDIQSAESVGLILGQVDKCNGYAFVAQQPSDSTVANLFQCAVQGEPEWEFERMARIYERYYSDTDATQTVEISPKSKIEP